MLCHTGYRAASASVPETWHKCGLLAFPAIVPAFNMLTFLRAVCAALLLTTAAQASDPAPAAETAAAASRETLTTAIRERQVVTFVYQGRARTVEPHACGIVSATGEAVLHGYQTDGESASGVPPGWRTFTVAKITALTVIGKTFAGPRQDYAAGRPQFAPLWAEVAASSSPAAATTTATP